MQSVPARGALAAAIAAYLVFFTTWSLNNHWGFATFGFDIGIFDQGVWLLSRLEEPFVTVRGLHLFGDHTSFILLLVVPFYWVFSSPTVLLVLQSLALGSAAIFVFMIAREKLRSEALAAGLGIAYLCQPAIQWTNLENFHPDSFQLPLLLLGIYMVMKKRWHLFLISIVLLLLVKEDAALVVFALGAYVAVRHHRKIGLLTMALSAAWLIAVVFVILPGFGEGEALYTGRVTGRFGGFGGFFKTAFTRPWELLAIMFGSEQRTYLWQLFAPLALLPLSSALMLVALPALAVNLLTTFGYQHDIRYHYSTLIVGAAMAATVQAIARAKWDRVRSLLVAGVIVTALTGSYLWGPAGRGNGYRADPASASAVAARRAIEMVPPDAAVSAHYSFVPHLTHRKQIYEFPNPWRASNWGDASLEGRELPYTDDVDVAVLREPAPGENTELIDRLLSEDFDVTFRAEGVMVLERRRD